MLLLYRNYQDAQSTATGNPAKLFYMEEHHTGVVAVSAQTVNRRLPFIAAVILSLVGVAFIIFALLIIFGGILNEPVSDVPVPSATPAQPQSFADDYRCENPVIVSSEQELYICISEERPLEEAEGYTACADELSDLDGVSQQVLMLYTKSSSQRLQTLTIKPDCTVGFRRFVSTDGELTDDVSVAVYSERLLLYQEYPVYTGDADTWVTAVYDFVRETQSMLTQNTSGEFVFADETLSVYAGRSAATSDLTIAVYSFETGETAQQTVPADDLAGDETFAGVTVSEEGGIYTAQVTVETQTGSRVITVAIEEPSD
ncbi:MAG: hypothetical protein TR69_WS6001001486 [candidate division WS6 bacterium OLB20]|uniref:Uncharacterized protein n=1 Tax=candidate division WS6 bacterium OLB20 TaxID=1617426 RepID=A0A136LW41_9BACT|nr:MAG: hypothetical protein TR69_WS6001001486 [candidate division WS6 bacterium OLB20]